MITSSYHPCLLISTNDSAFGIVGLQTDDTLILCNNIFSNKENEQLSEANITAKPKIELKPNNPIFFNRCVISQFRNTANILLKQKDQGKKIRLIDMNSLDFQQSYLEQRARGAYVATICQPEAIFDMSTAAQHKIIEEQEVKALNKRLKLANE